MFNILLAYGARRRTKFALQNAGQTTGQLLTLFSAALFFWLAVVLNGPARAIQAPWIITNDMGGSLEDRIIEIERMRAIGTPVQIVGTCVSACTLYLGLPSTCVMPQARLGFHGPRSTLQGIPLPRQKYEYFTHVMASYYPGGIRSWFMTDARLVTDTYYEITGRQAIAMGARSCV